MREGESAQAPVTVPFKGCPGLGGAITERSNRAYNCGVNWKTINKPVAKPVTNFSSSGVSDMFINTPWKVGEGFQHSTDNRNESNSVVAGNLSCTRDLIAIK